MPQPGDPELKQCNVCFTRKADDEFAKDMSREDELALTCRECNRDRAKGWYRENKERKKRLALEYNQAHRDGKETDPAIATENEPRKPRQSRAELKQAEKIDTEPDDYQFVRFSQGEWLFCLQEADRLGLKPGDYVRILVRDARRKGQAE